MHEDIPWRGNWKETIRSFKATDVDRLEVVAMVERALFDETRRYSPDVDHAYDIGLAAAGLPQRAIEEVVKRFIAQSPGNPWAWAMASWFIATYWDGIHLTSVDRDLLDGLIEALAMPPSGDMHLDDDTATGLVMALTYAESAITDDDTWKRIVGQVGELVRSRDLPEQVIEEYRDMRARAMARGISLN